MSLKSFAVIRYTLALIPLLLLALTHTSHGQDEVERQAQQLMDEGKTKEGIHLFERLATEGDDRSMVQLGAYYFEGKVIPQDYVKAMDWWLKALTKNNADAFVNLGVMHRYGKGAPANKKIAYCIFLTTYMNGLGNESTQQRAGENLRRMIRRISKKDIKDCLSNYTLPYLQAYLEAKGDMNGIPEKYQPSDKTPALKDLDWWLDGELNAIFGSPGEEEEKTCAEKQQQDADECAAIEHPIKLGPADWTPWMKPSYLFDDNTEDFNLRIGEEPKMKIIPIPANAPELRLRVFKDNP